MAQILLKADALEKESESDYILKPETNSVWITVDTLSVYIIRTPLGVVVDVFEIGDEMAESLGGTYVLFPEKTRSQ